MPSGTAGRLLLCVAALAATGCFVHRADWGPPGRGETRESARPAPGTLEKARSLETETRDRAGAAAAIRAWDRVLEEAPRHPEGLVSRSRMTLLLGAAYVDDCRERERFYDATMRDAERAMATSDEFRRRVESGEELWEAVDALGPEDLHAMNLWSTAVFYRYRDCFSSLERVLNLRWIRRAQAVMTRMSEIEPDWEDGALHFAWGIVHLALPEIAGGDREQAAADFAHAIELDSDRLLFRWGRGRYFCLETGDRECFRDDLEWVAAQDPEAAGGRPEWNVYFQREARELLTDIDRYFPKGPPSR